MEAAMFGLRRDLTTKDAARTLIPLRMMANREFEKTSAEAAEQGTPLDCKNKCPYCCYEPVLTTLLELAAIGEYVSTHFDDSAKAGLVERSQNYRRTRSLGQRIAPCPFLVDSSCSIYEARPLQCRGVNSTNVQTCQARLQNPGVRRADITALLWYCRALFDVAAKLSPMQQRIVPYDLGLHSEELASATTETPAIFATGAGPVPPNKPGEPSGIEPFTDDVMKFDGLFSKGRQEEAIQFASTFPTTERLLYSLKVPLVYSSDDEIQYWRTRYDTILWELEGTEIDAEKGLRALSYTTTFELAYQGLPVNDLLSRFGKSVHEKIIAPLFPDLVLPIEPKPKAGKIRVGFVSHKLGFYNGSQWALNWLQPKADDIELYAFNLASTSDEVSEQWILGTDHYYHLPYPTPAAARFIKECDLDVLIFTEIGMTTRGMQLAGMRLAPVQCTSWGHPVTSGMPTIDYYLSSDGMETAHGQNDYTEKLVRLPNSGFVFRKRPPTPVPTLPPLPETPFAFMGQTLGKCVPKWDHLFAEISQRLNQPIVFIKGSASGDTAIMEARLQKAGVNALWLPRLTPPQFNEVMARAAVSLDPPAWSGGNTTVEALERGTPVVTFPQESMRSRHSLAFLKKAKADGLVAQSGEDYVDLATNPDRRQAAMQTLDADALFREEGIVLALQNFFRKVSPRQ
jgi:Fe-S-cluster containining protein